ncbi:2941_t:CDS:2, partial [Dentiscutata heterogama]
SLQEYLNDYLLPATQDNASLDDIKKHYMARNLAINLLKKIGTTFTTNTSKSRIDNWLYTYNICSAAGEAKQIGIKNYIYYAQAYYIEKEAFLSLLPTLIAKLNKNDAKKYPSRVNKACSASIDILKEIVDTNFGSR